MCAIVWERDHSKGFVKIVTDDSAKKVQQEQVKTSRRRLPKKVGPTYVRISTWTPINIDSFAIVQS